MKHVILPLCTALLLSACQGKTAPSPDAPSPDKASDIAQDGIVKTDPNFVPVRTAIKVPKDGRITVSPEPLVSEDAACILPLRVSNGTDGPVSVSMFSFAVTGPGNDDSGNMFAQLTPSGEARTARVILIGQSCPAFDTVTIDEILCVSGDDKCAVPVEVESSEELKLIGPN